MLGPVRVTCAYQVVTLTERRVSATSVVTSLTTRRKTTDVPLLACRVGA